MTTGSARRPSHPDRRHGPDPASAGPGASSRLFWLLFAGLGLKLLGGFARYYQAFILYDKGDARSYHEVGVQVAQHFLHGHFGPGGAASAPKT